MPRINIVGTRFDCWELGGLFQNIHFYYVSEENTCLCVSYFQSVASERRIHNYTLMNAYIIITTVIIITVY